MEMPGVNYGDLAFRRTQVTAVEIDGGTFDLRADGYLSVLALVSLHGLPLGTVRVPVVDGWCRAGWIRQAILDHLEDELVRAHLVDSLAGEAPSRTESITVAVCTRDRAGNLASCLDAIDALSPAPDEVIVVDNASRDPGVRRVVESHPRVRYVPEPRAGLDHARNAAIAAASCDIVSFTDDDVIVDPRWVGAVREAFAGDPQVAAVTGLVMPHEIETPAQQLFESYGGFGRGFAARWFHVDRRGGERAARLYAGSGQFGTGANMSFRRTMFSVVGGFDPALDVGTVTNGGGDLDMFFRVLEAGFTLCYEPAAVVWHRHRRTYEELRTQLTNNGIGFYSYLVRNALAFPGQRRDFVWIGAWWLWYWNVRRFIVSTVKPGRFPRDLVAAELRGSIVGLWRYFQARRRTDARMEVPPRAAVAGEPAPAETAAERRIDLDRPLAPLTGISAHGSVKVTVARGGSLVGTFTVANRHRDVGALQLAALIVDRYGSAVVGLDRHTLLDGLRAKYDLDTAAAPVLPAHDAVSIVVATFDRPNDLRRCLQSLTSQRTARPVEIIVVDNHPASGLTAPVVAEYPGVLLVEERRQGLSYARNAGIAASTGEIVVMTDDDVVAPGEWVERLVQPFADPAVSVVTGDVRPADLSSRAQRLFEAYGGLGRGTERRRAGPAWFWACRGAVPTWLLGATANAAVRASAFAEPAIGAMHEMLGAGSPTGCSEDTYLFYRVLRAGHDIVYEPAAFVWHHHRTDMRALRAQLYAYAKGHVAYQLLTLVNEHDLRAGGRLLVQLPLVYLRRIRDAMLRRSGYPLSLIAVELAGTAAGPLALVRAAVRRLRLGPSARYVLPSQRAQSARVPGRAPSRPSSRAAGP